MWDRNSDQQHAPIWRPAGNPGTCPDGESNRWPFSPQAGAQPTEPTSQGTCLGYRLGSQLGVCKKQPHADVSLPLFLPPFLYLKINKLNLFLKCFIYFFVCFITLAETFSTVLNSSGYSGFFRSNLLCYYEIFQT